LCERIWLTYEMRRYCAYNLRLSENKCTILSEKNTLQVWFEKVGAGRPATKASMACLWSSNAGVRTFASRGPENTSEQAPPSKSTSRSAPVMVSSRKCRIPCLRITSSYLTEQRKRIPRRDQSKKKVTSSYLVALATWFNATTRALKDCL